jgi:C-terminal processing protease CtpA/Prc
LQVTVFDIRSSDGKQLNRIGVTPDEVIDGGVPDAAGDDPVLSRAVAILHDGQGSAAPGAAAAAVAA